MEQKIKPNINELMRLAKNNILNSTYGKFDYLEDLFGIEYIVKTKPRILIQHIAELLELKKEEINYKSFTSWQGRNKLRQKNIDSNSLVANKNETISSETKNPWEFEPSPPGKPTDRLDTSTIIKVANTDK